MGIEYLTPQEVADILGVHKSTIIRRTKNDPDFPGAVYVGERSPRYVRHEVDEYLLNNREKATA